MMITGRYDANYKSPEERKRLKQLNKHKATCAKNRRKRKNKRKSR